jgi:5-(carboxyamino)imidazole ribonucleotide mutase
MKPRVMILLGSASDLQIAEKTLDILETLEIPYDVKVASAHRTHKKVKEIVMRATNDGIDVFIGIAGLSAHLPGMIAANTHKPVIGVPVEVKLGGLDALYASAQMPFGAPVATMGIDRGENAALFAAQIIGIHDEDVKKRVTLMRNSFFEKIAEDEKNLVENIQGEYYSPQLYIPEDDLKNKDLSQEYVVDELENIDVAIIAGSYSDIKVAKKATNFLDKMKINYDFSVISPVRYPKRFEEYLKKVKNAKLFIAITGLSSHVTGAIVAYTEKPVIGVPCSIRLDGMDSLLSMINMPPGVPVGTLGIDNGGNAAILASEMLALKDKKIERDIKRFKGNIEVTQ